MKKVKPILIVFLFILFLPFIVNAETCETNAITIESIEINNKSENVIEQSEPVINGKILELELKMSEVGDSIEYKMLLKNDSKEDYELEKTLLSSNSDYLEYMFMTKDNSNIVKALETKEVILKIQYKNEVSDESFVNGIYTDNKNFQVYLSNKNTETVPDTVKNPNTRVQLYILILFALLLIIIIMYVVLKKLKYIKYIALIIGMIIIIPIGVHAICKCEIKLNSKIAIVKKTFNIIKGNPNNLTTGDIIAVGNEEFYVIDSDSNGKTVLLAKHNLKVGTVYDNNLSKIKEYTEEDDSFGIQSEEYGGVKYNTKKDILERYKAYLVDTSQLPEEVKVRLITLSELVNLGCNSKYYNWPNGDTCQAAPSWISDSSYWTQSLYSNSGPSMFCVWTTSITAYNTNKDYYFGIRPVLEVGTNLLLSK